MKKIIYSYIGNKHIQKFVDLLNDKYNWKPIAFLGRSYENNAIRKYYKDPIFFNSMDIRKTNFDYSKISKKIPIDEEIINNLSKYKHYYLEWLQDTTGWNFSIYERKRYFYEILTYWNSVICDLKPDIYISYTVPHMPAEYALYLLCKHHFKIPTLFCDITSYFDNSYFVIQGNLENLSERFINDYKNNDKKVLSNEVKEYLENLRNKPSEPEAFLKYYSFTQTKKESLLSKILKFIRLIISRNGFKEAEVTFKKNTKPFKISQLTNLGLFLFNQKINKRHQNLLNYYTKNVKAINKNEKFIYFASPYQPEIYSNTSPGPYEDIFLILDTLSSVIPDDWKIYYKEHPNIFYKKSNYTLSRSKEFYDKLKLNKKIILVSHKTSTFELIDASQAVATVGGTVGWEAIIRNKPALVFGNIWYSECQSVFNIRNFNEAENAISKILKGYVININDVNNYAQSIYENSFKNEFDIEALNVYKKHKDYDDKFLSEYFSNIGEEYYKAYNKIYIN